MCVKMSKSNNTYLELNVKKKNNSIQQFDKDKLTSSVSRAGTPYLVVKDITDNIIERLKSESNDNVIDSSRIREIVAEELKSKNHNTNAESYLGYSKNKMTSIREEQMGSNKYDSKVSVSTNSQSKQFAQDKDNTAGRGSKSSSPQSHQR